LQFWWTDSIICCYSMVCNWQEGCIGEQITVLGTLLGCKPAIAHVVVSPSIVICRGGNLATADL
jgi:hypothetical protein